MSTTNSTTPATQTRAPNPAPDARARLLEAIEEASFEPATQETHNTHAQVRHQRDAWWNHIVTTFFLGDEARMFRELRISGVVFEAIVNAVADLPLQRRGRRSFIFTHQEHVLFSTSSTHTFRSVLHNTNRIQNSQLSQVRSLLAV